MTYAEKFQNGIRLTEDEVRELTWKDDIPKDITFIDSEDGDIGRWTQEIVYVFRTNDNNPRYYEIHFYAGLTEMQDNEYPSQVAQRVVPHKRIITDWVPYDPLTD